MSKVLCGIFAIGLSYGATISTFTSRSLFTSAIGGSQTFDFNQPNGPVSNLGSLLSISTLGGDPNGQVLSNNLCGSSAGAVDCFPPVLFTFTQPGSAFGDLLFAN